MREEIEKIHISSDEDLQYLITRFHNGPPFAFSFVFTSNELQDRFLRAVNVDLDKFNSCYFFYDRDRGIHISESENGYVWISTMGLVAKSRNTNNKFINTLGWQSSILLNLLDEAITLSKDDRTYDIDSYNYSKVQELTPAVLHNTFFYFEVLCKAYLSVYEQDVPKTHSLAILLSRVKNTMFQKQQNNTLFHAHAIPLIEGVVSHISSIPGGFREQYVKYDDNPQDLTVIDFHPDHLKNIRDLVVITCDMVSEMYYDPDNCIFLGKDLYQRLKKKCETDKDRERLEKTYGFLLDVP